MKRISPIWLVLTLIAVIYFFASCATPEPKLHSAETFYRRDMLIEVDGKTYPGYGVLPLRDEYNFKVTTKHDMDRFLATSCHRQIVEEKVGDTGWFSKKATYKFTFKRASGVEQSDPCPLQLVGSADSNEHSFGFLEFQTSADTLPAVLECDGWKNTYNGVSVCQAKKGLVQKISFQTPVRTAFDSGCELPIPSDKKNFVYEIPRGRCVMVFCNEQRQCHRLTTIGYDEAWVRGQK